MLANEIVRNGLSAGMLIGLVLPFVGSIILFRRLTFIADSLGHVNMSGIAFMLFISSLVPILSSFSYLIVILWTVLSAVLIEYLREKYKDYKEMSITLVYSLAVALTSIFLSLTESYNSSLFNILFGNINAVSTSQLLFIFISVSGCLIYLYFNYKKLLLFSLEEEYVKLYSLNPKKMKYFCIIIIAIVITMTIKIVGVLITSSMLVIPLLASANVSKNLKMTLLITLIINEFSILLGYFTAYYLDVSASAMIVIFMMLCYGLSVLYKIRR